MSWLSRNIIDPISSIFDSDEGSKTVVSSSDSGQKGDGFFSSSSFYDGLLNAGASLAAIYFKQTGDKDLAEQAAKQRMAELEAAAKLKGSGGGGGGGGAGAALKIAKMNNLSALYQNYANLRAKMGSDEAQTAIDTGRLMQAPLNVRSGVLI